MHDLYGEEILDIVYEKDIKSGKFFEHKVAAFLKEKYPKSHVVTQNAIGNKPGYNKPYIADTVIDNIIVSSKSQTTTGSQTTKFVEEMVALQHMCKKFNFKKAYIVYEGKGFNEKLIQSYQSDEYKEYCNCPNVKIVPYRIFKEMDIMND